MSDGTVYRDFWESEEAVETLPKLKPDVVDGHKLGSTESRIDCVKHPKPQMLPPILVCVLVRGRRKNIEALRAAPVVYLKKGRHRKNIESIAN